MLTNFLLFVIAIALVAIAARPYVDPAPALAQSASAHAFYIEPGGADAAVSGWDRAGVWEGRCRPAEREGVGIPTGTTDPYPSNPLDSKPTTSRPFALGKFAFEDTEK